MREWYSEIKKNLYLPVFLLSCLGVALICCFSEGYMSINGKHYTIMELLLFLHRETMLAEISLNRYEIWKQGIGTWSQLLFPLLLSIGYLVMLSCEKKTGFNRLLLTRENNIKYCVSKLLSAMISGGIIILCGYLLFGLIVYMRFPAVQEYSAEQLDYYMGIHPDFHEVLWIGKRCVGIFLYGMGVNVFAYFVSVWFTDQYILCCLPIMLKYILDRAVTKIVTDAMSHDWDTLLTLGSSLYLENLLNIDMPVSFGLTLLFVILLYLCGFFLMLYCLTKRGEDYGFE